MKRILDFLRELQEHNDREWFETHRTEYLRVKAATEEFAARLIAGIASFDSTVGDLTPKECTYRIYRDIRFSSDKRPYKSHIGIFISPGGKKSGHSGYYLHIEPEHPERSDGVPAGGPMLVTGLYCPNRPSSKASGKRFCSTAKSSSAISDRHRTSRSTGRMHSNGYRSVFRQTPPMPSTSG